MQENAVRLFIKVRNFSSASVAAAIFLSVLFSGFLGKETMGWQIALAIFALAIGIPHGALDHLITLPKNEPKKMAIFIAIYVAVAIIAVIGILKFNIVGFILVLLMSAVHFGIGDTAFINEIDKRSASRAKLLRSAYIPAAGFTPVFIPLVNSASTDALAKVNPSLINWHQGLDQEILTVVTSFSVISIVVLLITRRVREAIDLTLLLALALITPPLIAFAVYFGCWHAMRHTARLTLSLPLTEQNLSEGKLNKAFLNAVIPGLPALVGTLVVAAGLALSGKDFTDDFFWMALVVVWALTVPHMAVTAKLDKAALA
ncbi:MAG: Brp/Blh family beta-carotene 15,15'-dioxygenase [Acidobacteriota bacterium]|nr:Brp/Blh family beta-carotene 15,15'-dioxygenase [Acidobacteriota bacterium]